MSRKYVKRLLNKDPKNVTFKYVKHYDYKNIVKKEEEKPMKNKEFYVFLTLKRHENEIVPDNCLRGFTLPRIREIIMIDDAIAAVSLPPMINAVKTNKLDIILEEVESEILKMYMYMGEDVGFIVSTMIHRMIDIYIQKQLKKNKEIVKEDYGIILKYSLNFMEKLLDMRTVNYEALLKVLFDNINKEYNKVFRTQLAVYNYFLLDDEGIGYDDLFKEMPEEVKEKVDTNSSYPFIEEDDESEVL